MATETRHNIVFGIGAEENLKKLKSSLDLIKKRSIAQKNAILNTKNQFTTEKMQSKLTGLGPKHINDMTIAQRTQMNAMQQKLSATKAQESALNSLVRSQESSIEKQGKQTEKSRVADDMMKKLNTDAAGLSNTLRQNGLVLGDNGKLANIFGKEVKFADQNMNKLRAGTAKFNMNLLSLMFGFQMVSKAIWGFMKSSMTAYDKANGEQSAFAKSTNKLKAGFEFLKYSLIDALTQTGLFKFLIKAAFWLVNMFNKLPSSVKKIIVWVLVLTGVLASALAALGAYGLLWKGLKGFAWFTAMGSWFTKMGGWIKTAGKSVLGLGGKFTKMGKVGKTSMSSFMISLFAIVLVIAGLYMMITGIIDIVKFWGKDSTKVVDGIVKVLIGLGLILLGVALFFGLWPVAIAAAVVLMIAVIVKYWKYVVKAFTQIWGFIKKGFVHMVSFIKILFWGWLKVLVSAGLYLLEKYIWLQTQIHKGFIYLAFGIQKVFAGAFAWIVNKVIDLAESIVRILNKIPGVNIKLTGLEKAREWANSLVPTINKARDAALALAEKPLEAVKKLQEKSNSYFNNKIGQIRTERDEKLKAITAETKAKVNSINKQIELEKKAREANGTDTMKGSLFGGSTSNNMLTNMFSGGKISSDTVVAGSGTKEIIQNITNIENFNQDISAETIDIDSIKQITKDVLDEETIKYQGSANS